MKIKKSIECWIIHKDKQEVLLLQVPEKKARPSFFQPITGGIEGDETPGQACCREVFEETGLKINTSEVACVKSGFKVDIDDQLQIDKTIYYIYTDHFTPVLSPSEHVSYKWVKSTDVQANLMYQSNIDTWDLVETEIASA